MVDKKSDIIDATASESVCKFCDEGFQCGVLKTAMEILDTESLECLNLDARVRYEKLRFKLEQLGYQYPFSKQYCRLSGHPEAIKDLVDDAAALIGIMRDVQKSM